MKTHHIIIAIIIALSTFGACTPKENTDLKITIVPAPGMRAVTLNDMNAAAGVIIKRLSNSLGITSENIKQEVTPDNILLTIHNADSSQIANIREVITSQPGLEFRETYENSEIIGSLIKANDLLREKEKIATKDNPLLDILIPRVNAEGKPLPSCVIGLVKGADTSAVIRYLEMPDIKALFPPDLKFMWSLNPYKYDPSGSSYELHAIKVTNPDGSASLDGSAISYARAVKGHSGSDLKINLSMSPEGSAKWAKITGENIGKCIAVIVDGHVRSYPRVQDEITGGNTEITGDFNEKEADDLVNILKSGQLPFDVRITSVEIK